VANSILIIDDDVALLRNLGSAFERYGWDVHRELAGEAGLATYARALPDVVLVDLHLPGIDGLEVLDALREHDAVVMLLTGDDHLPTAVRAMSLGAENFLVKPVDLEHLIAAADRAAEKARLKRVNMALVGQAGADPAADPFGDAPSMRRLQEQMLVLARSDHQAIAIEGETGSGRALVAQRIHDLSTRRDEALIHCVAATTDPQALELTLFGVESAIVEVVSRPGLAEVADQGTLLLREITHAPLAIQAKLAEMLDHRAVRRSGGSREIPVDVRLIVTVPTELEWATTDGLVEPALFFRLKASRVHVPPLRELPARYQAAALQRVLRAMARGVPGAPVVLTDEALERLVSHPWPGNFLEARHVLERALLLARGQAAIGPEHLPGEFRDRSGPFDRRHTPLTMEEVERMHIDRTLKHHGGNRTRAAQELGISRATLIAKIKRYAIVH
jgi:DNA-binding NtrC family response regulator